MDNYIKQAKQFLKDTNTTFKSKFYKYDKHFPSDTEKRNIYSITLRNSNHSYTFKFGQSINNTRTNTSPTEYDVLACLTKYNPDAYEDFCNDYGYDIDEKSSKRIYKAVCNEYENISKLWDSEQIELLSEIN